MKSYFLPLLAVLCAACDHQPTVYHAPAAAKLVAKQQSAARHVAAAKGKFAAASVKLRGTQQSHTKAAAANAEATRWLTLVVPAVEQLLLKVPEDLKPEVEALKLKVQALSAEIEKTAGLMAVTTAGLASTQAEQSGGMTEIELANADINEINTKHSPEYLAAVEALAAKATEESTGKAEWHNKYDALARQGWMHKILGIAGALAVLGLIFLWWTGRLAGAGAKAAVAVGRAVR